MAFSFLPTNANTLSVQLGVNHLLDGYIVQNESITENTENLNIADQKGRVAQVIAFDKSYSMSLQVIGPVEGMTYKAGDTLEWYDADNNEMDYIIQSVKLDCVYNDVAKYSIEAVAWPHASYSDKTEEAL